MKWSALVMEFFEDLPWRSTLALFLIGICYAASANGQVTSGAGCPSTCDGIEKGYRGLAMVTREYKMRSGKSKRIVRLRKNYFVFDGRCFFPTEPTSGTGWLHVDTSNAEAGVIADGHLMHGTYLWLGRNGRLLAQEKYEAGFCLERREFVRSTGRMFVLVTYAKAPWNIEEGRTMMQEQVWDQKTGQQVSHHIEMVRGGKWVDLNMLRR